ncbi:hypothetical protein [Chryseobacterium sp. SIMBA_029]|uniref:FEKKY domain-containing protein n=1 Tax=Chryseobacterium sp. SIMBA_029 TaxID=3085772 RepID=UPI003978C0B5
MNKKPIYLNIFVVLLLAGAHIGSYYLINYPMRFSFWSMIKESQVKYLGAILAGTALITYLISNILIKNLSFKRKFIRIFLILNSIILMVIVYHSVRTFMTTQKEISQAEHEYIKQAEKDIKNDSVIIKYSGGFSLPQYDQKTTRKIDSIYKKYGIMYKNTGCIIDLVDNEAQKKYEETVKPYLEKRNGTGWEIKMKKEISNIKKSYPYK